MRNLAPALFALVLVAFAIKAGIEHADAVTAVPGPDTATDSPYVPANYVKVFGDEFNDKQLDTSKWWTRFVYDNGTLDHLNDEQQRYAEDGNHVLTGRSLILTAKKANNGPDGADYQSGMIRSKTTFKFGYFETRAKAPSAIGVWPAFWLNSAARGSDGKLTWPPEIDIFELVNNGVEDTVQMLHMGAQSNGPQGLNVLYADQNFDRRWNFWQAPFSFADDFHVFGGLWTDDNTVSIYVDGRLLYKAAYKWVYDDNTAAGLAHVILNLAIGGPKWAGRHGVDDSAFPQGFEIDYVRVYQKRGQQKIGRDTIGTDLCPPNGGC
jgi:beta-glucanase (GH16 family)